MHEIAVVVGSLRKDSINRKLAGAIEKLAESRIRFTYPDIGKLPHYNEDLWASIPESVTEFKQQISASDAVLWVTPEYNRSLPGVLKNAIDWGSRPQGKNSWAGKPVSIVGTSPGAIGTAVAQAHLRSILPVLGMVPMGQPEVYFQFKPGLIDENLEVSDVTTKALLERYLAALEKWIGQHSARGASSIDR